jgi:hypothetical protein
VTRKSLQPYPNILPQGSRSEWLLYGWKVIKEDIMAVLSDYVYGKFEKSLNATFLSLIPKVPWAFELKEFGPISLVSGIYKFIAKFLANRMRRVVDRVISKP